MYIYQICGMDIWSIGTYLLEFWTRRLRPIDWRQKIRWTMWRLAF
jgi:hypothetical protein